MLVFALLFCELTQAVGVEIFPKFSFGIRNVHVIACKAPLPVKWYHGATQIVQHKEMFILQYMNDFSMLIIPEVLTKHNGVYSCEGYTENSIRFNLSSEIFTTKAFAISPSKIRAQQGDNHALLCKLRGPVRWYHKFRSSSVWRPHYDFSDVLSTNSILQINSVKSRHSGEYFCVSGASFDDARIYVFEPNRVAPSELTVEVNSEAKFKASGSVLRWSFNGYNLGSSKVLNIISASTLDQGMYILEGRDQNGYLFYSEGKLKVKRKVQSKAPRKVAVYPKHILKAKKDRKQYIRIHCESAQPVEWYMKGQLISDKFPNEAEYLREGDYTYVLHIKKVLPKFNGVYVCQGMNSNGETSSDSSEVLIAHKLPRNVNYSEIPIGENAQVKCSDWSESEEPMRIYFQEFKEGSSIKLISEHYVVLFHSFKPQHSGIYTCAKKEENGQKVYMESFTLIAKAPGLVQPQEMTVYLYSEVTFTCQASTIQRWKVPLSTPFNEFYQEDNFLHISKVSFDHDGKYKCIGKDNDGYDIISESTLNIVLKESRVSPSHETIMVGDSVEFHCDYHFNINWLYKNGPLPKNAQVTQIGHVSILTINRVTKDNEGTYYCNGRDKKWLKSQSEAKLSVYYIHEMKETESEQDIVIGGKMSHSHMSVPLQLGVFICTILAFYI